MKTNIRTIIAQRLELQSTQKAMWENFQMPPKVEALYLPAFQAKYKSWSEEKQKKFLIMLGGKTNFKKTKHLLDTI